METKAFYQYLPTRYEADKNQWAVRNLVWAFKAGRRSSIVARLVASYLRKTFGADCSNLTFVCIPASSAEKTISRYQAFCEEVSVISGCINGFGAVRVSGQRMAIHESRTAKRVEDTHVVYFDRQALEGRRCIVFDDVITRGGSFARFSRGLEMFGASVVAGLFLAQTINL